MPELCRFFGIVIRMYVGDHPPPHFHAEYGGQEVQVSIGEETSLHDARFLLRVIADCWDDIFRHQFPISSQASVRNLVNSLRSDGNTWAHTEPIEEFEAQHESVGNAMMHNPVPMLIPCHRVVPSRGGIGKWGYGTTLKDRLLRREGVVL